MRRVYQDRPGVDIRHAWDYIDWNYIQLLIMQESSSKEKDWRATIRESKESEPLKFKLLSMLGLKEYLIDKYVFLRSQPQYQIVERQGRKKFVSENPIKYPEEYSVEVSMVQDANHSIPAVLMSLNNRDEYCGTVIYSHGNSSDMLNSLYFISKFAKTFPRFDYLVYDYTGYGQSKKTSITEFSITEDLRLLIETMRIPDQEIILWGFSLGTFPTAKVAAKRNFKGIILQSPLASVYSLFSEGLSAYSSFQNDCFNLMDHITEINSFLIIAHSKDDQIVPFSHSKALFERYQMINSNPFCFLMEVTGLKHNHMHAYLCDTEKNQIRDSFHAYMKLIIEQSSLPTTRMFQLTKNKYFDNLGSLADAEYIDTTDKKTNEETKDINLTLTQSFNFSQIKKQRVFQLDEVTTQTGIDFNYYMQVKADKHSKYFSVSKQAREETEHDTILNEEEIPQVYD